jgi:P27 family predicted phage terminase small subunit
LKLVKGTGQKCRMNEHEPKLPPSVLQPPAHLSEAAREAWGKIGQIVSDMGILTGGDPLALEGLCGAYADLLAARASLERPIYCGDDVVAVGGSPTYITVGKNGNLMIRARPEIALIKDADRRLAMWLAKFGMSPADRSRVSAAPTVDGNPFAKLDTHAQSPGPTRRK